MNHLNEKNSVLNRPMYLCLCPVCLGQFLDTGIYKIVRENHGQAKERCDFCNYRNGFYMVSRINMMQLSLIVCHHWE